LVFDIIIDINCMSNVNRKKEGAIEKMMFLGDKIMKVFLEYFSTYE